MAETMILQPTNPNFTPVTTEVAETPSSQIHKTRELLCSTVSQVMEHTVPQGERGLQLKKEVASMTKQRDDAIKLIDSQQLQIQKSLALYKNLSKDPESIVMQRGNDLKLVDSLRCQIALKDKHLNSKEADLIASRDIGSQIHEKHNLELAKKEKELILPNRS
jgi:hypothetical protein